MTNEELENYTEARIIVRFNDGEIVSGILFRDSFDMPQPWYLNKPPTPAGYETLRRFAANEVETAYRKQSRFS